jgi:hypothetical protein
MICAFVIVFIIKAAVRYAMRRPIRQFHDAIRAELDVR